MTIWSAEEMRRDEAVAPYLARYQAEAYRELLAEKRPGWHAIINTIKPAVAAVQADKETTK